MAWLLEVEQYITVQGDKGLKMLNLSDRYVSDIISSNMLGVNCVATSGDKLYYTNTHTYRDML